MEYLFFWWSVTWWQKWPRWQWKSCMSWNDKSLTRITEQGRFIPFFCRTAWRGALTARHQFSRGGLQIAAYIGWGAEERDVCAHGIPRTNIFFKFRGEQSYQKISKSGRSDFIAQQPLSAQSGQNTSQSVLNIPPKLLTTIAWLLCQVLIQSTFLGSLEGSQTSPI